YVNHACDPTSRGVGPSFEVAVRDIRPGEQLTSDYAELNITAAFRCRCGAADCRGVVRADDLLRDGEEWDAAVAAVAPLLLRVPAPLGAFGEGDGVPEALRGGRGAVPPRRHYHAAGQTSAAPVGGLARGGLWRLVAQDVGV